MTYETLLIDRSGPVVTVTINRPKSLNALDDQVLDELIALARDLAGDPEARAVILTGAGEKAFVAGANINTLRAMAGDPARVNAYAHRIQAMTVAWERLPMAVIMAVNGFALGGGCELAMAGDVRLASENARFGQPEINLGIIPGAGGTQRLARLIGKGNAKLMVLSGDQIDAQEAFRLGLVQRVTPPQELLPEAMKLALQLAGKAPIALRLCKEAIDEGSEVDLDRGLAIEAHCFGIVFGTKDAHEGMSAFLERRSAAFSGS